MYGFSEPHITAQTNHVTLWRADNVLCVRIEGVLDDAASDRWRTMVSDSIAKQGAPRFIAVDFSQCDPQNSMAARYRSAAFARETMKRIEHGVVLTGGTAGPTVVVRAVLRAIGLPNLDLHTDARAFADAIGTMRKGTKPNPAARLAS
jgi:anti-anti-sigma regulatory factor